MTNEQTINQLKALEHDMRVLVARLDQVIADESTGLATLTKGVIALRELVDNRKPPELIRQGYQDIAIAIAKGNFSNNIAELTNKIYADDQGAETIVRRLQVLSTEQERKIEHEIIKMLDSIMLKCNLLIRSANSLVEIEADLALRAQKMDARRINWIEESKYAERLESTFTALVDKCSRAIKTMTADDETAENLFEKIKHLALV